MILWGTSSSESRPKGHFPPSAWRLHWLGRIETHSVRVLAFKPRRLNENKPLSNQRSCWDVGASEWCWFNWIWKPCHQPWGSIQYSVLLKWLLCKGTCITLCIYPVRFTGQVCKRHSLVLLVTHWGTFWECHKATFRERDGMYGISEQPYAQL